MADIELVIKISEEQKKMVDAIIELSPQVENDLISAIRHGTPLSKGHGDLVDRDAINSRYYGIYTELESLSNKPSYKELLDKLSMCLDTATLIIDADKEVNDNGKNDI